MNLIMRKIDKIFRVWYHACAMRYIRKSDMNLITVIFGIFWGLCVILEPRRKQRADRKEGFVMSFLGFLLNVFSIVVLGDYNPVMLPDGSLEEDSAVYDFAYHIAHAIGTIA